MDGGRESRVWLGDDVVHTSSLDISDDPVDGLYPVVGRGRRSALEHDLLRQLATQDRPAVVAAHPRTRRCGHDDVALQRAAFTGEDGQLRRKKGE